MEPVEILKIDAQRNHGGIDHRQLIAFINSEVKVGAKLMQENSTLILFKTVEDQKAEFHTFNAGSAADLAKNVELFMQMLKQIGYVAAYTEYTNPAISKLFTTYGGDKYEIEVTENEDGTFRAEVAL
jgi:hypothetical protein